MPSADLITGAQFRIEKTMKTTTHYNEIHWHVDPTVWLHFLVVALRAI